MSEFDAAFVFLPLPEAQIYFNHNEDVTAIAQYADDPDHIDRHFRKLVYAAAGRPIYILDWRRRNAAFVNALQLEHNVAQQSCGADVRLSSYAGGAGSVMSSRRSELIRILLFSPVQPGSDLA